MSTIITQIAYMKMYPAQKLKLWMIPSLQPLGVSAPPPLLERPLWEQHETELQATQAI